MDWTDENNKELKNMLRGGATYQELAYHFKVSRSTIAGKVDRLKLSKSCIGDRPRAARKPREKPAIPPAPIAVEETKLLLAQPTPPEMARERAQRAFVADAICDSGKPLAELRDGDCRWPLGRFAETAQLFCGKARAIGAYCREHSQIAYERRGVEHDRSRRLDSNGKRTDVLSLRSAPRRNPY